MKLLQILLMISTFIWAHGNILMLNFSGMTPHIGQQLQVRIVDKNNGEEVARKTLSAIDQADFQMFFDGVENGHNYNVDFYADLNGNKKYDDPPTDHTWRLSADNVNGDVVLDFSHNTNFTTLDWQQALTVRFTGMTPHVGEMLGVRLIDKKTRHEISRETLRAIESADFDITLPGIQKGDEYRIDFFC